MVSKSLGPSQSVTEREPKSSPPGRTPNFGTKFCSWTLTETTSACRQISKCKMCLMFHSQTLNPSLIRRDSSPWKLSDSQHCPSNPRDLGQLSTPHPPKRQKAAQEGILPVSPIPAPQETGRAVSKHTLGVILPPKLGSDKAETEQDPQ